MASVSIPAPGTDLGPCRHSDSRRQRPSGLAHRLCAELDAERRLGGRS